MKYIYFIVCHLLFLSLSASERVDFDHGFSLGDLSFYKSEKDTLVSGTILGYRLIESNSGLGFTVNGVVSKNRSDDIDIKIYNSIDILSLEVNWEPLYNNGASWGLGPFYRVDSYISSEHSIDWRTGCRFDFRYSDKGVVYPFVALEVGYWKNDGLYIGLKFDPVIALIIIGLSTA